jgi:hypothetical protein
VLVQCGVLLAEVVNEFQDVYSEYRLHGVGWAAVAFCAESIRFYIGV